MLADERLEARPVRVDLAATPDFDLGALRIRPAHRQACFPSGECRELEPRVMQVLVALAQRAGEVVSRDQLIVSCWNGRIVGDDALNRCVLAVRKLARELEPPPFEIKTIPRIGYCLSILQDGTAACEGPPGEAPKEALRRRLRRPGTMAAAAAALFALVATLMFIWPLVRPAAADEPASIAVLPFRNLAAGEPYFAEGVAEEILGQLAREPQFRVLGRTSSAMFRDGDVRQTARKLDVRYVLDGSVRSQNGHVRVQVALVDAREGVQLWTGRYDGRLDDIFSIQQRIGAATANALQRRLVRAPALKGPLVTSGDVYNLYLTARGLLRSRDSGKISGAIDILHRAVALDPNYAPAWSSLGAALAMTDPLPGAEGGANMREAQRYVRRALALAPNLAEAHGTLGMVMGFDKPEAVAHIRRAAALDPNSAENMFWLGNVEMGAGNFEKALAAYRRASEIDPLWFAPGRSAVTVAIQMGDLQEAQGYINRVRDPHPVGMFSGRIAYDRGDLSGAAAQFAQQVPSEHPSAPQVRRAALGEVLTVLGLPDRGLAPPEEQRIFRTMLTRTPTLAEWRARNLTPEASYRNGNWSEAAAKRLLLAGRGAALAPDYFSEVGLLGLGWRSPSPALVQVESAALVALILRQGGRVEEAERVLTRADAQIARILRQGRVPYTFIVSAAEVWAVQGRQDWALGALERAFARGWRHVGDAALPDMADEPTFAALRGHLRFKQLRAQIAAELARERREAQALGM